MKRVEAIIRHEKLYDLLDELNKHQFYGVTVTNALGCGIQKGEAKLLRGIEYNNDYVKKIKIELIIKDHWLDELIDVIIKTLGTGKIGDGKIIVCEIENVYRVRTGEMGERAID
ncbi:MAG: P-II family nitrogen regulator [Clostridiales bacterium]